MNIPTKYSAVLCEILHKQYNKQCEILHKQYADLDWIDMRRSFSVYLETNH